MDEIAISSTSTAGIQSLLVIGLSRCGFVCEFDCKTRGEKTITLTAAIDSGFIVFCTMPGATLRERSRPRPRHQMGIFFHDRGSCSFANTSCPPEPVDPLPLPPPPSASG